MDALSTLFYALVFPGFLFLALLALLFQYIDRKVVARVQGRIGPPLLQPLADFVKLLGKEVISPEGSDSRVLSAAPLVALAAVFAAFLLMPVSGPSPLGFAGDLPVALYLLTLPTVIMLVVGFASKSAYTSLGGARAVTLLFMYEVPFYLALLAPAIAAGSWSMGAIVEWQSGNGLLVLSQPLALAVALIGLQAKLERAPFDIAEAETELIAGPWTELTGRRLAVMRLSFDAALVAGCVLVALLFLGGGALPGDPHPYWLVAVAVVLLKAFLVALVLIVVRAAFGRLRVDQFSSFGWRVLAPAAVLQVFVVLVTVGGGWP